MNKSIETSKKIEYQAPILEQHPPFVTITGVSLPFGTVSNQEGEDQ